ncbi:restriction endonuclease subunit S [Clostridium kluyveri]|uniref:restriction endonuclease subunit S n=1 Tax=Clostridium kluyveri TaxID=1534 RepID=UPI0022472146|nr:restriction endonuclease subunit S [Clostridium kluyveri]UZQ50283.1 restriction endonuclease subunit S [Clostridium kluyveri]
MPERWKEINLKDYIIALESGKRPKGGAVDNGVPSLGGEHINGLGGFNIEPNKLKYVPREFYEKMKSGIIKKNDILIVKDGATTGKIAFVDSNFILREACINEHVFLLRTSEVLHNKFLTYYLRSNMGQQQILNDFRGATVGGISKDFVNFNMLLPPLETQKKIVRILEKAERALEKKKEVSRLLDEYLKSVFVEMFGDPQYNKFMWTVATLGNICTFIKDGPHVSPKYVESGIPFISVNNIINGEWDFTNVRYISREDYEIFSKRCKPEYGDVLYTKGGTTGFAKYIDIDIEFSNWVHLAVLKYDKSKINGIFLERMLNTSYCYAQSQRYTRGIANRDLVLSQMKRIKVFIPPIELQNKFADIVCRVKAFKVKNSKSRIQLENLFNSLMQKAFRGELEFN